LYETLTSGLAAGQLGVFAVGLAVSALAGFAAIWGLLRYLQRASMTAFIVYRIVLGLALLGLVVLR
jgi:undecaprenyl-diphosphatase